jgi:glutamyl/glutaminyl-tRNA synthetase
MHTTRIAPSPTGMMHIGTARTALFNWLAARATGGQFILRMDDTDADRNVVEAEQPIYDGLKWLGLDWDRFVRQSERTEVYASYVKRLVDAGFATTADNGAIMLAWQPFMPRVWRDEIGGDIRVSDKAVEEIDGRLCLVRGGEKMGQATYQFASIVDDWDLGVNFIIRGTDHIANTAKQVAIFSALNHASSTPLDMPKFAHVGLIFKDKKKMSKRDGAASLLDYRDRDYDPDGIFNFLLRLGWGPKVDDKASTFMDRARATALFLEGGNLRSANSNFDEQKLEFYDRRYKQMKGKAQNA